MALEWDYPWPCPVLCSEPGSQAEPGHLALRVGRFPQATGVRITSGRAAARISVLFPDAPHSDNDRPSLPLRSPRAPLGKAALASPPAPCAAKQGANHSESAAPELNVN